MRKWRLQHDKNDLTAHIFRNLMKSNLLADANEEDENEEDDENDEDEEDEEHVNTHEHETELHTDASIDGFGAVLLQKSPDDGLMHPVYYMSKKTTDAERKFTSYELEILAVVEALHKFRVYLLGLHFKLVSDCNAFTKTIDKKDVCARVARWILLLQDYDFDVEHRAGTRIRHADALSRYPVMMISNDSMHSKIKYLQAQDDELKAIIDILAEKDTHNNYFMKSDLLHKLVDDDELIVVPLALQREIIKQAHEKGHFSVKKTKDMIGKEYYIPKLDDKIQRQIRCCIPCIVLNRKLGKKEGELHPLPKEEAPLQTLHIDFLGPLESTHRQYKHILAVIDGFTKFCWLYPTKTTSAKEVVTKLQAQSITFGNPVQLVSDKGSAFTSEEFKQYCNEENIRHHAVTTGLPRANGQVERLNAIIVSVLSKLSIDDPSKWYKYVEKVQQTINSTFCRSTHMTPFELLVGIKMRTKDDIQIKELIHEEMVQSFNDNRDELRKNAKQQILKVQEENKKSYNLRRRPASTYKTKRAKRHGKDADDGDSFNYSSVPDTALSGRHPWLRLDALCLMLAAPN
ncbi:hypothetical protein ACLKA6_009235 [Drosophila palustris]